jgi:hypothetical protein
MYGGARDAEPARGNDPSGAGDGARPEMPGACPASIRATACFTNIGYRVAGTLALAFSISSTRSRNAVTFGGTCFAAGVTM